MFYSHQHDVNAMLMTHVQCFCYSCGISMHQADCSSIPCAERWRPTLLDTLAWAPRGSSSLPLSLSGMGRAAPRIWRRLLLTSGPTSGSRWLMLGSSTFPATLSRTMTRSLTPPPCSALFRNATHGLEERSGSTPTSQWLGVTPLSLLWR
jgi:hypothetical protein